MKRISLLIAFALALAFNFGCKGKEKSVSAADKKENKTAEESYYTGPPLLTFENGEVVTKDEFEYVYAKNNGGLEEARKDSLQEYKEYLDLYINFKRKVMDAEERNLHLTVAFQNEFETYRKQLAQPYLVAKEVQDNLIKEAYDRSKKTVEASHILFSVGPEANPDDTLLKYQKALKIRDSIVNHGLDFDKAAQRHSSDPSAKENKGYLGYFSVFDMVYPFETGAYNTAPGTVSRPVRTAYGYHLIKVHDKFDRSGKKSVAHIIVRVGPQYSAKDTNMARERINEIYEKLKSGADFAELAKSYSDDPVSGKKGGELGSGRLIPEMEERKLKMSEGEISEPFKTAYGWHILKVTEAEPMKSFEEARPQIKSKISRDARSYLSRDVLINRVKKEGNYTEYQENLDKLNEAIDEAGKYGKGFWRPDDSLHGHLYPLKVYSIGSGKEQQVGTIRDLINFYVNNRKGIDGNRIPEITENLMKDFRRKEVLRYEESLLPKKYPEYRELVKEYRDGILLFTLTESKVWRKAVEDTTGLRNYYEKNKEDYRAGERVEVTEYVSKDKNVLTQVKRKLAKDMSPEEIEKEINEQSSLNVTIRTNTYEKGEDEVLVKDIFSKEKGFVSDIVSYDGGFKVLVVNQKKPAGIRSFEEARAELITDYQNHLENRWLEELEERYPVTVHGDVLKNLYEDSEE